jgi:hypothetical protein
VGSVGAPQPQRYGLSSIPNSVISKEAVQVRPDGGHGNAESRSDFLVSAAARSKSEDLLEPAAPTATMCHLAPHGWLTLLRVLN